MASGLDVSSVIFGTLSLSPGYVLILVLDRLRIKPCTLLPFSN